jgi:hypothetical protein
VKFKFTVKTTTEVNTKTRTSPILNQTSEPITSTEPTTTTEISTTEQVTTSEELTSEDSTSDSTNEMTSSTTDSTTESGDYSTFIVKCYRGSIAVSRNNSYRERFYENGSISISERDHDIYDSINLVRPAVSFHFNGGNKETEIEIHFDSDIVEYYNDLFLIYYPGSIDAKTLSDESAQVHCRIISDSKITIDALTPTILYTFCAILRDQKNISPFQCKSNQSHKIDLREPWLYKEQKVYLNKVIYHLYLINDLT